MKHDNTVSRSDEVAPEVSRICCLARVNSLLKSLRARHEHSTSERLGIDARRFAEDEDDLQAPTPHDFFVGELEASITPEPFRTAPANEANVQFDSPREIARARLVFAATLVVPLLLITSGLALFGGQLGSASSSLLRFSALALATPLILALARFALHSGWQGIRAHPVIALTGVAATGGYATSAFAMSVADAGSSPTLALSIAGLLVMAVYVAHWLRVRRVPA